MGNVAGRLYALSTLGSLAGTLLTTFLLIPLMGTTKILYSIGVVLLAASVLALAARFAARGGPRTGAGAVATGIFLGGSFVLAWGLSPMGLPLSLTPTSGLALRAAPRSEEQPGARIHPRGMGPYEFLVGGREYDSAYHTISVVGQYTPEKALAARAGAAAGPEEEGEEEKKEDGEEKKDGEKKKDAPLIVMKPEEAMRLDPDAVLQMRFNNLIESALYPNRPGHPPETVYTRILHMGVALHPEARKVLVVGLGGGSVPREFCEIYADRNVEVDVVEVDPLVVAVAREHFFHRDEKGVKTYVGDGRQFVRRAGASRHREYDMIVLDAYSGGGHIPAHLVTREFLEQCRARLAPGGVVVSNIISALEGRKSRFFRAEYKTMRQVFGEIYVFPSRRGGDPESIRNLILVATTGKEPRLLTGELVGRAEKLLAAYPALKERTANRYVRGGALESFARNHYQVTEAELAGLPVLTDEYAPVETMFYWTTRFGR
jgi:spermidine synthase